MIILFTEEGNSDLLESTPLREWKLLQILDTALWLCLKLRTSIVIENSRVLGLWFLKTLSNLEDKVGSPWNPSGQPQNWPPPHSSSLSFEGWDLRRRVGWFHWWITGHQRVRFIIIYLVFFQFLPRSKWVAVWQGKARVLTDREQTWLTGLASLWEKLMATASKYTSRNAPPVHFLSPNVCGH